MMDRFADICFVLGMTGVLSGVLALAFGYDAALIPCVVVSVGAALGMLGALLVDRL